MTALAMDVRELSASEVDGVSGGPIWFAIALGVTLLALEEPIKGFVDGLHAGFQDDK